MDAPPTPPHYWDQWTHHQTTGINGRTTTLHTYVQLAGVDGWDVDHLQLQTFLGCNGASRSAIIAQTPQTHPGRQ
jgi:hypothetical protein